jgi:hypothetical protein
VSDDTDKALRTFLAQTGGKKGDLSEFVEQAVRSRLFHLTAAGIKERNRDFDQNDIINAVNEAVAHVRFAAHHPPIFCTRHGATGSIRW